MQRPTAQTDASYLVQPFPEMRTFANRGIQTDELSRGSRHSSLETVLLELATVRAIRTADWLLLFNSSNTSSTTTRAIDSATITLGRSMSPLTDVCGTPAMFVHRAAPRTECKQGPRAHTALTPGYRYPSTSATTPRFRLQHLPDRDHTTASSSTTSFGGPTFQVLGETGSS